MVVDQELASNASAWAHLVVASISIRSVNTCQNLPEPLTRFSASYADYGISLLSIVESGPDSTDAQQGKG